MPYNYQLGGKLYSHCMPLPSNARSIYPLLYAYTFAYSVSVLLGLGLAPPHTQALAGSTPFVFTRRSKSCSMGVEHTDYRPYAFLSPPPSLEQNRYSSQKHATLVLGGIAKHHDNPFKPIFRLGNSCRHPLVDATCLYALDTPTYRSKYSLKPYHRGVKVEKRLTLTHKFIAAFAYMLPLLDTLQAFIVPLTIQFPSAASLFQIINRILYVYSNIPMLSYSLFMGSYMIFVKKNIFHFPYFVKYNVMQTLIMSMFQYASAMIYFRLFPYNAMDTSPINEVIMLTIVFSSLATIFNSMLTALLGRYPKLPVISEAVNMHIGDKPEDDV